MQYMHRGERWRDPPVPRKSHLLRGMLAEAPELTGDKYVGAWKADVKEGQVLLWLRFCVGWLVLHPALAFHMLSAHHTAHPRFPMRMPGVPTAGDVHLGQHR